MPRNNWPMVRIRTHLATQLTDDPANLAASVNDFLEKYLSPPIQPETRRFSNQTYTLVATGLDVRPGPSGCKKRWGDRYSSFRVVLGRDGDWAVYGLPKNN